MISPMEKGFAGHKRGREEGDGQTLSPVANRLHADLLRNILCEEEPDDVDCGPADVELATVIQSLEEEIAVLPVKISSDVEGKSVEIVYLQEASDDELGIPPPVEASMAGDEASTALDEAADGFGRIWGYEDDGLPAWYEGFLEFGSLANWDSGEVVENAAAGALFDGEVFDGNNFSWQPTSLSAL